MQVVSSQVPYIPFASAILVIYEKLVLDRVVTCSGSSFLEPGAPAVFTEASTPLISDPHFPTTEELRQAYRPYEVGK